ncbi:MAG: bifunctional diguanylate cyclase/phosphodiesterase, partial [Candidatus Limnocylindrales bacterium]
MTATASGRLGASLPHRLRSALHGEGPRTVAVVGFTASLALVALSLVLPVAARPPILGIAAPWWVFVLMYAAAEAFPVHLEVGRETHSFSLNEVPLVLGLALLTPGELVTAQALGAGIALVLRRRQSPRKLAFNLASFAFSTAVAIHVYWLLVDPADPLGPRGWLAAYAAALMADITSSLTVQSVIAIATGQRPDSTGVSVRGELYTIANASLGLVGLVLVVREPQATWLAGLLAIAMYAAYRVSVREQDRRRRLMALHAATRGLQDSLSSSQVTRQVLGEARAMFGAEWAELILLPEGDDPPVRLRVAEDHGPVEHVPVAHIEVLWRGMALAGRAAGVDVRDAAAGLRPAFEAEGIRELVAAPLALEGGPALLVVANRMGHVGAWPADEVPALETFASHALVALRNSELMEDAAARAAESEHQARHDPLTGLPTRAWFQELFSRATGSRQERPTSVLRVEVEGFAEVTERLGHENGDLMLQEVGRRLVGILGPGERATRLTGERFALSLVGDPPEAHARSLAERVVRSLERPVTIDGLPVNVSAVVGIALAEAGVDAAQLLRRADRAVAIAHEERSAVELYTPDRDPQGPLRLALVSEVRHALDTHAIAVWYQPRLSLVTGRVIGAEALVRWIHPDRGVVPPGMFLPVVEQTRLIRPLTLSVLERSVATCARWAGLGMPLSVSVNLSPRNLLDADLASDIRRILTDSSLPPRSLIVEVTESAVTADHQRANAILSELRAMGVRVAIDDFGTGYSSLTRLRQLPVDEIKLDRSFVSRIEHDEQDRAIVRSVIGLAHDLGMTVVAEGVETRACWDWLASHGCDEAQGYLMGRPMPLEDLEASLGPRSAPTPSVNRVSKQA